MVMAPDESTMRRQRQCGGHARRHRLEPQHREHPQRHRGDDRHAEPDRVGIGTDRTERHQHRDQEHRRHSQKAHVPARRAILQHHQGRDHGDRRKGGDGDAGQRIFLEHGEQRLHLAHFAEPDRPDRRIDHAERSPRTDGFNQQQDRGRRDWLAPRIASGAGRDVLMLQPTGQRQNQAATHHRGECVDGDAVAGMAQPMLRTDGDEEACDRTRRQPPAIRNQIGGVLPVEHIAQREHGAAGGEIGHRFEADGQRRAREQARRHRAPSHPVRPHGRGQGRASSARSGHYDGRCGPAVNC